MRMTGLGRDSTSRTARLYLSGGTNSNLTNIERGCDNDQRNEWSMRISKA